MTRTIHRNQENRAEPSAIREATAGDEVIAIQGVEASRTLVEISETIFEQTRLEAVAVVDGLRPIGLLTREALTAILSARFGHALFANRSAAEFADRDALIQVEDSTLEHCLQRAFERSEKRAYDDLIIVDRGGNYRGLLSVKRLILYQTWRLEVERARKRAAEEKGRILEEVAAMKSNFIAAMTHELRAPIHTILGASELIETYLAANDSERAFRRLRTLRVTSMHLRALIDNILDQAKLEAGKVETIGEECDLTALIEEVADGTAILLRPEVQLRRELGIERATIQTDPIKLRQILTNLASNAAKFTERGSVTFRLTPLPREYEIAIEDTGPGIAAESLPLIFEPFTQLENVKTRRYGGTGLGLSLSKSLAERLGATLNVSSEFGKGATFTLRLPRELRTI